jgi:ribosome-associated protein
METVRIHTEFIKLESLLKYCGHCLTGGEAKGLIAEGKVSVNGEVCTQRGRKIHDRDQVSAEGRQYVVKYTG